MKLFILFVVIAVATARSLSNSDLDDQWETFKKIFNKKFNDVQEEASRRQIWEKRINDIITHNVWADLGKFSHRRGINEFSDMDHDEFVKIFNGYKHHLKTKNGTLWVKPSNIDLPETVDWRQKGLVTPVKNQEQCGSCWAFSTTGSLEGQHKKSTGKLVSLSEQNLVDCSGPEGNMGCEGGLMDSAFQYIKKNNGIDTESSYPYTAEDGDRCLFKKSNVGATCTGYVDIPSGNEDALKKAVAAVGPISVAIDASHESFQSYQSGIYNEPDCSSEELDHGVLVVGYGTEDGADYWLVKNSWGISWGINGYIKMSRNANNQCGIATQASYPLV